MVAKDGPGRKNPRSCCRQHRGPQRSSGEDRLSLIVSSVDWIVWRVLGFIVLLGPIAILGLAALVAGFPSATLTTATIFAVLGVPLLLVILDNVRLLVAVSRKA